MLRGIYSAAAGMTSQMVQTDVIADNIANVNTPGYKHSSVHFQTFGEALVKRLDAGKQTELGNLSQGSQVYGSVIQFTQGDLQESGNPLDVALEGDGFFTIRNTELDKLMYTRAGNFTRDAEGYLAMPDGGRVQGSSGDIPIPSNAKSIIFGKTGEILIDGVSVGRLQLANFDHPDLLKKVGNNLFSTAEAPQRDVPQVTVAQGFVERSNANVITELVNNMNGARIYETLQKSIQMQNETLGKAVNEVGRPLG